MTPELKGSSPTLGVVVNAAAYDAGAQGFVSHSRYFSFKKSNDSSSFTKQIQHYGGGGGSATIPESTPPHQKISPFKHLYVTTPSRIYPSLLKKWIYSGRERLILEGLHVGLDFERGGIDI